MTKKSEYVLKTLHSDQELTSQQLTQLQKMLLPEDEDEDYWDQQIAADKKAREAHYFDPDEIII